MPFLHIFPSEAAPASKDGPGPGERRGPFGANHIFLSDNESVRSGPGATEASDESMGRHPSLDKSPASCGLAVPPLPQPLTIWPQGREAAEMLDDCRTNMAHLCPFIVIPSEMTADELRETRPLLWKATMMEACQFNAQRQIAMGTELLHDITAAALLTPERSLDLLQALQLLVSWYVSPQPRRPLSRSPTNSRPGSTTA